MGYARLSNAEISPKFTAGVSRKRHPLNWEHGCALEGLSFGPGSWGWDGTTALPISYSFSGLSAGKEQKLCISFKYSFYIAISVLASRG